MSETNNKLETNEDEKLSTEWLRVINYAYMSQPMIEHCPLLQSDLENTIYVLIKPDEVLEMVLADVSDMGRLLCLVTHEAFYRLKNESELPDTDKCSGGTKWFSEKFVDEEGMILNLDKRSLEAILSPAEAMAFFMWVEGPHVELDNIEQFWTKKRFETQRQAFLNEITHESPIDWNCSIETFERTSWYIARRRVKHKGKAVRLKAVKEYVFMAHQLSARFQSCPLDKISSLIPCCLADPTNNYDILAGNRKQIMQTLARHAFESMPYSCNEDLKELDFTLREKIVEKVWIEFSTFLENMSETDILGYLIWRISPSHKSLPDSLHEFWTSSDFEALRNDVLSDIFGTSGRSIEFKINADKVYIAIHHKN